MKNVECIYENVWYSCQIHISLRREKKWIKNFPFAIYVHIENILSSTRILFFLAVLLLRVLFKILFATEMLVCVLMMDRNVSSLRRMRWLGSRKIQRLETNDDNAGSGDGKIRKGKIKRMLLNSMMIFIC